MAQKPDSLESLRRFELNLLVAFDILVAERSVTAAARRMGIGQPVMSNALSRLRAMFGDPLLIRTLSGLQPTGRALDLVEPVSRILAELREEVFSTRAFDPATDKRTFRIGLSDQAEAAIMRDVLQVIRRNAPGIRVIARSVEMRLGAELLATSAIDLAIGYFPEVAKAAWKPPPCIVKPLCACLTHGLAGWTRRCRWTSTRRCRTSSCRCGASRSGTWTSCCRPPGAAAM